MAEARLESSSGLLECSFSNRKCGRHGMICWVLAMEMLQGVRKQHVRPRAVVGYGVKIFLPSPSNYVTRSPGFTWKFFNHVLTSKKKTPPSCEAIMLKKGRINEVDSFQVLVFKLVSILVYVVVLNTLIICFQQLPLRSLHWTLGWTTCYKRFSRSLLKLKTFGLYRAILHWLVNEQTGLSAGKYVWANHICFAFVTDWLKLWREYDFTSNHRAHDLKTKTLWHK